MFNNRRFLLPLIILRESLFDLAFEVFLDFTTELYATTRP